MPIQQDHRFLIQAARRFSVHKAVSQIPGLNSKGQIISCPPHHISPVKDFFNHICDTTNEITRSENRWSLLSSDNRKKLKTGDPFWAINYYDYETVSSSKKPDTGFFHVELKQYLYVPLGALPFGSSCYFHANYEGNTISSFILGHGIQIPWGVIEYYNEYQLIDENWILTLIDRHINLKTTRPLKTVLNSDPQEELSLSNGLLAILGAICTIDQFSIVPPRVQEEALELDLSSCHAADSQSQCSLGTGPDGIRIFYRHDQTSDDPALKSIEVLWDKLFKLAQEEEKKIRSKKPWERIARVYPDKPHPIGSVC